MPSSKKKLHILIAPNAFKNSLPADEVAEALAKGLQQALPDANFNCCPVGDGGDGTGKILALHLKARKQMYKTVDPLGRTITAPVYYTNNHTAIIELSDASGLKLLRADEYDPMCANTFGTGTLIKKALDRKVKRILLAIGGSATVDGGTGMLTALGAKFTNSKSVEIKGLAGLTDLQHIDLSEMDLRLKQTDLIVLCDVKNKLLGARGAVRMFGPQKGATQAKISQLETILSRLDKIVFQSFGIKMSAQAYSGAAGGVAGSLEAICGANTVNGIDFFLDAIQFNQQLEQAGILITGEGSLDAQTLEGKAPFGVAQRAKKAGIKVIGVAGKIELTNKKLHNYFDQLIDINPPNTSLVKALKNTRVNLVKTGKKIGKLL